MTLQRVETEASKGWKTGWTSVEPAEIGFVWAPDDGGEYVERDGFHCRELGLEETSGGALGVRRIRVSDRQAASCWRSLNADFDLLFVIRGSVVVENELGAAISFLAGGAALHPKGLRYRLLEFSEDFEAVHVTSPARAELSKDEPDPRVQRSESLAAVPTYTNDTEDQYVMGNGSRRNFLYRDLGTREPTDSRIDFHVMRATAPGRGIGWHYHSMAQWFMVLGGTSVFRLEDRPRQPLAWGDAMCVGRGPRMRHNVTDYSGDYAILEMCVPADHDTIEVAEPVGADAE
jgi:hypothetical protein